MGKFTSATSSLGFKNTVFNTKIGDKKNSFNNKYNYSNDYKQQYAFLNTNIFTYKPLPITHTLPSSPASGTPIIYNGSLYGQPQFRLKPVPSSDTGEIYFEELEDQLILKFILQAFRTEPNVIPLDFRSISIGVNFYSESEKKEIRLDLSSTNLKAVYIDQPNVLKDIHASLDIPTKYRADIYKAFTDKGVNIDVYADVWWKKPDVENTAPLLKWIAPTPSADVTLATGSSIHAKVEARDENEILHVKLWINNQLVRQENNAPYDWGASDQNDPLIQNLLPGQYILTATATDKTNKTSSITRTFRIAEPRGLAITRFNPSTLRLARSISFIKVPQGILFPNGKYFMQFKTEAAARNALQIIQFYKFDTRCIVQGSGKYRFEYFLAGGKPPNGTARIKEDVIRFNPAAIRIVEKGGAYYIYEGSSHSMLFFGNNKSAAYQAYQLIKTYGFDQECFVERPDPPMQYWKRSTPHTGATPSAVSTRTYNVESTGSHTGVAASAQKVDVQTKLFLKFDEKDHYVFRGVFGDLVTEAYKWEKRSIPNPMPQAGEPNSFTIHYRQTTDPNFYFFLPQVFRLRANDIGIPDVRILMWKTGDNLSDYQIAVECSVLPYIHPNAKKDLLEKLYATKGKKYVDLGVGGYESASFSIDGGFKSIFEALGGKEIFVDGNKVEDSGVAVTSAGFSLKFITSLESFDDLKRRFEEGFEVGKLEYKLQEETESGQSITGSYPIKVEISLQKLANLIPQVIVQYKEEAIDANDVDSSTTEIPTGIHLRNTYPYPLSIKGVDLTLLSKVEEEIYDLDYQVFTERQDYPMALPNGEITLDLALDEGDIKKITVPGLFWTDLISAPYGVSFSEPASNIMKKIIDHTNKDSVPWNLEVEYRFGWEDMSSVIIVVTDMEETPASLKSVRLTADAAKQHIQMITTLNQYLDTSTGFNRSYKYKVRYEYAAGAIKEDQDWKISSVFESDFLSVALAPASSDT